MLKAKYLGGGSLLAVAVSLGLAQSAAAQAEPAGEVSEVVVTGSFIAGTPEDSALPVDVTTAQELQKQGSPTVVQLVKALPAAAGSIGESNRFLGNNAGTATVNLRGFGSARTLVLMNGRRMATTPAGVATAGAVDINTIPVAAIGRIEVLKGGAAATYGSDAVGGVVNFITRRDLDGFEVNAEYNHIEGSAGDYNGSIAWGWKGDRGNILLTAGYRRRSELRTTDRDWAIQPNALNPFGGWSGASNPGAYQTFAVGAGGLTQQPNGSFTLPAGAASVPLTTFNDVGCTELGGSRTATGGCSFQFSRFDNLVNDEFHYQLYGEANFDVTDDVTFHAEAFWTRHDVPDERVSPSQSTAQFPAPIAAGGSSPFPAFGGQATSRFYIPFANPGLQAFFTSQCTGVTSAMCTNIRNGAVTSQTGWRPLGYGGNPLFGDGADHQRRANDTFRISTGLKGHIFNDIGWDAAVTYMDSRSTNETPDIVTERLELALRGLGGPGCNPATGTPGAGGCQWFNPFSNGVRQDAVAGNPNPLFNPAAVPANTNTRELFDWMHQHVIEDNQSRILVGDLVLNGGAGFNLPGGEVKWALGGQLRYDELSNRASNALADMAGATNGVGPFTFYPAINANSVDRTVSAVFGEVQLPILDNLNASIAVRHERYGGSIGSTTNPKFDVKWQALDWLAFRGSVGTTFRAPPQGAVSAGANGRILAQVADPTTGVALYRPIDVFANPNLQPETATTYDVGVIVSAGGFNATVDYWNFAFKDELTTETGASIVSTLFPSAAPSTWQCSNAALTSRVNFAVNPINGSNCHPSNVLGVRTNWINGPSVDTSGVDFQASYMFPEFGGGDLTLGVEGSYLIEYKRGALLTLQGVQIQPALDRAGQLELLSNFYSYPRLKANAFANWSMGRHNVRATVRYVGQMDDRNHDRAPTVPGVQPAPVGSFVQLDLVYRVELPWDTTLTAQIQNVFDEEPSVAYSQYNYDYTLGNPLGRVIGVGVRKRF